MSSSLTRLCYGILLAAVTLGACATRQLLRPGELAPVTAQVAGDQRIVVWQHAIGVLLDEGYVPQVLDATACYVSAKQRDDVTVGAIAGTLAIVTVSPEGILRLQVSGTGVYRSADQLSHDLDAIQHRLIEKITSDYQPHGVPPTAPAPSTRVFTVPPTS